MSNFNCFVLSWLLCSSIWVTKWCELNASEIKLSIIYDANTSSDSTEIPHILWKSKVSYRIHNRPSPVPILSRTYSVQACTLLSSATEETHASQSVHKEMPLKWIILSRIMLTLKQNTLFVIKFTSCFVVALYLCKLKTVAKMARNNGFSHLSHFESKQYFKGDYMSLSVWHLGTQIEVNVGLI